MARCKDCIHENVCLHRANIQTDTYTYMGVNYDTEKCKYFKATADVVPKSEVDILVRDLRFKNIECDQLRERITKAKQEVAREIFEEIEKEIKLALTFSAIHKELSNSEKVYDWESYADGKVGALLHMDNAIAELKKKYTEEKQ